MLTPEMVSATAKESWVTWRAQPPFWMRRGALLKDAQLSGMSPTSVAGGENAAGNWSLMAGFCGPGSVMLLGFLALMAPCGGSFGLPKLMSLLIGVPSAAVAAFAAVVIVAAVNAPPTAVAANMSRLENIVSLHLEGKLSNAEVTVSIWRATKFESEIIKLQVRRPVRRCVARQARIAWSMRVRINQSSRPRRSRRDHLIRQARASRRRKPPLASSRRTACFAACRDRYRQPASYRA